MPVFVGWKDASFATALLSARSTPRRNAEINQYIADTVDVPTRLRFEATPTPRDLQPVSGVDARAEEEDDINIGSSQGVEVAPIVIEDDVTETEQPNEETMDVPPPDPQINDAVKARAMDVRILLNSGSTEVGERTGAICVLSTFFP